VNWLDTHAGSVQALAALASTVVTLVLAILTAKYVALTREIARTATEQADYLRSSAVSLRKENAVALEALAVRLRPPLVGLEATSPSHESLFKYSQLEPSDIVTLEALARAVSGDAVVMASKAATGLRTIHGFIEQARRINLSTGWILPTKASESYYTARQSALAELDDLARFCRQVAA
jgi:hypothetical protein